MNADEAVDVKHALTVLTGGFLGTLFFACLFALALAALLMPIYVILMNDKLKRMQWLMERQLDELRKIRERWDP